MTFRPTNMVREAKAGLDEKSDVRVYVSLAEENSGVQIDTESALMSLFGDQVHVSAVDVI